MNHSQPNPSESSHRFAAQQAFFESLDQLNNLMDNSDSETIANKEMQKSSKLSSSNDLFSSVNWDDVAADIDQVLNENFNEGESKGRRGNVSLASSFPTIGHGQRRNRNQQRDETQAVARPLLQGRRYFMSFRRILN